jgi:hypothetical protein
LTTKYELSEIVEIEIFEIVANAEPSINQTWRGIVIDLREEENILDSTHINSESHSNEIDESDLQNEKHDEQRIRTWRWIMTDVIRACSKAPRPTWVTRRAEWGKKGRRGKNNVAARGQTQSVGRCWSAGCTNSPVRDDQTNSTHPDKTSSRLHSHRPCTSNLRWLFRF